jgi:hypothetical protein
MSSPQTVLLPIEIPYTDQDGQAKVRKCYLTLSLSIADLITTGGDLSEQGFGEITIQGAVMPVDDPKGGGAAMSAKPQALKYRAKKKKAA